MVYPIETTGLNNLFGASDDEILRLNTVHIIAYLMCLMYRGIQIFFEFSSFLKSDKSRSGKARVFTLQYSFFTSRMHVHVETSNKSSVYKNTHWTTSFKE